MDRRVERREQELLLRQVGYDAERAAREADKKNHGEKRTPKRGKKTQANAKEKSVKGSEEKGSLSLLEPLVDRERVKS
jgi:hypothetical protein